MFTDEVHSIYTIFALGHDINVADILQKKCQFVTGQLLIVNDYSGKRHLDPLPETCTSISIRYLRILTDLTAFATQVSSHILQRQGHSQAAAHAQGGEPALCFTPQHFV